jgi:alkanesulfonate monooxygenase SsuD/methylene tetrahydromethanopterin reductase-like flavin-dependent oxidoreductase (luciferase family)
VHLPGYANPLGDAPERFLLSAESAERAARQGTAIVTTVAATELFQPSPEMLAALRTVQRQNLARLQMARAKLLIGSDVFVGTARAEVQALDQLGAIPRHELLRLATLDTPRALFPDRRIGCFEPGCEASFLLLIGDPLEDLAHLDQPLLRVKQGRLLTQLAQVAAASSLASASTADPPKKRTSAKKASKPGSKKQAAKPTSANATKKAARSTAAKPR